MCENTNGFSSLASILGEFIILYFKVTLSYFLSGYIILIMQILYTDVLILENNIPLC